MAVRASFPWLMILATSQINDVDKPEEAFGDEYDIDMSDTDKGCSFHGHDF